MATFSVPAVLTAAAVALACLGLGLAAEPPKVSSPPDLPDAPVAQAEVKHPLTVPPVPSEGAKPAAVGSKNFVVSAPTPVVARALAAEAEHQRAVIARRWLGKELPDWAKPCELRFTTATTSNGASTLTFGKDADGKQALATVSMDLRGDFLKVLSEVLPHEVTHAVLATAFARPLPRWADEGLAISSESDDEQAVHDARCRELVNGGRGFRLKVLFTATEYPRDLIVLYAQGHSVARFLLHHAAGVPVLKDTPIVGRLFAAAGHQRLLTFIESGSRENTAASWATAAKEVYGFASLDALEEEWLKWLAKPETALPRKEESPTPKAADPNLIPPPKRP
ncbi:MAG: hypothetical protein K2V38_19630 [Gemmataceae bacterium]|nr:hypothetical protein [Gemmataceae bacterium]